MRGLGGERNGVQRLLAAAMLAALSMARDGAAAAPIAEAPAAAAPIGAVSAACADDNPYFAASRLTRRSGADPGASLLAFYDTPGDDLSQQLTLASWSDVGCVFGLAYDWRRGHLYAAAYHRRAAPLGPGGPGQIYRLDLHTARLEPLARIDAGPDRHAVGDATDAAAAQWVGLSGLGDIEVNAAGDELLAVDLSDRSIYRFRLPDGAPLGAFAVGSARQPWAARARPFGLGVRGDWVYHGVVELPEAAGAGPPVAHLYRSRADGADMAEVARVELSYRSAPPWATWSEEGDDESAEPMLVDVEFAADSSPILGLRDRRADTTLRASAGDVLPLRGRDGAWSAVTWPEYFEDQFVTDEALLGGLAGFPGVDLLVAAAANPVVAGTGGAVYLDVATGRAIVRETVAAGAAAGADAFAPLGDLEALCGPPGAPTVAPTPTAMPTVTPLPTARPRPAYLPVAMRLRCPDKRVDVVLVLDMSTSMRWLSADGAVKHEAAVAAARRFLGLLTLGAAGGLAADRVAIVGFHADAWPEVALTDDRAALDAGLSRLATRVDAGSRLDLALLAGRAALPDPTPADRLGAMIVLTDGVPTGVPAAEDGSSVTTVLRAAEAARSTGTLLFTVGFGTAAALDESLLRAIAGDPQRYHFAARAETLADVYGHLAQAVRCPTQPVGGR